MSYIIWKGINSNTIKGLIISELPPITKPKMRVQETEINGVDGSIIEELGYEAYDKTLKIGLTRDANIDEVISYFTGEGQAIFSNEADRYYKARILEQIDYERLLRFKTANVKFRVQPFKYEEGGEETTENVSEGNVIKLENAKIPSFKLYGITKQNNYKGTNLTKLNNYEVNVNNNYYQNNLLLENFKNNTTYTLSFDVVCNKEPFVMELGYGDDNFDLSIPNEYYQNQTNGHKKITFTTNNETYKNLWVRIPRFNTQETYNANVTNMMLVEGTVEKEYEPYVGGKASPNPDYPQEIKVATGSVSVKSTTKNKLKNSSFKENFTNWNYHPTIEITEKLGQKCMHIPCQLGTSAITVVQDIKNAVENNKIYTISAYFYLENIVTGTTNPTLSLYIDGTKLDGGWTSGTNTIKGAPSFKSYDYSKGFVKLSWTFKIVDDLDLTKPFKLYVYTRDHTGDLYLYDLQLEEGEVDTEYQEYQESSITYDLGDNFLADKDYIQDSVLNKNIGKVVLNGSENWNLWSTNVFYIPKLTEKINCTSTHFKFVTTPGASALNNGEFCITTSANNYCVLFKNTDYDNVADFKAWLGENNVEVYYELPTPEQIELETTGELKAFEPNTIITNDLDSNMVVYYLDMPIAENKGNYYAKPIITIEGTGTIEFILNGNKIFRYTFPDEDNIVVIDSEKQDAYLGPVLKNRYMSGEFPVFEIGKNIISWEGKITNIKIASKSRWL